MGWKLENPAYNAGNRGRYAANRGIYAISQDLWRYKRSKSWNIRYKC